MNSSERLTRIVIAEDSIPIRDLLTRMVEDFSHEAVVVALAGNAEDTLTAVERHAPDLVVLDLKMPQRGRMLDPKKFEHGLRALACLRRRPNPPRVVVVSNIGENPHEYLVIERAREFGIDGFLSKGDDIDSDMLLHAIRAAMQQREPVCSQKIAPVLAGLSELTARQRMIFLQLAEGKTNSEIEDQLSIGIETVRTHVRGVLEKLHVSSREELIAYPEDRAIVQLRFESACREMLRQ